MCHVLYQGRIERQEGIQLPYDYLEGEMLVGY